MQMWMGLLPPKPQSRHLNACENGRPIPVAADHLQAQSLVKIIEEPEGKAQYFRSGW
jgi:hypothetical protein